MYSLKTTSIGRADNFRIGGEIKPSSDEQRNMGGRDCHHDWVAGILVLRGVVAQVLGRRENGESELNTWRSAAIFATVLA